MSETPTQEGRTEGGSTGSRRSLGAETSVPEVTSADRSVDVWRDRKWIAGTVGIILGLVGLFMVGLWLYGVLAHFLFLLLMAWLFAAAMNPAIVWLMGRGVGRGLATAITTGVSVLAMLLLVVVFGNLFVQQASDMVKTLPGVVTSLIQWSNAHFHTDLNASSVIASLHLDSGQISATVSVIAGSAFSVIDSFGSVLIDTVTVLVFAIYIAAAGPHFLQAIARGMRPGAQRVFINVAEISAAKTGGYVGSKIVLAALSAFFHGVVFVIIGVPHWLPFALLVGVTAQFVPLIGTYIGIILPVLATVFDSPVKAVVIIAFAAVYQQIESYVFTPRVSQKTMDVNPAVALAAVFVGAAVWGPIGALIGIPLVAAIVAIAETYSRRYDLIPELATLTPAVPAAQAEAAPASAAPPTTSTD